MPAKDFPAARWDRHDEEWRSPMDVAALSKGVARIDPALLRGRASRGFWPLLERLGVTLLVSREYEHLMVGLSAAGGEPDVTYFGLPHPSGIAVDRERGRVYVAATRNPNQLVEFAPVESTILRADAKPAKRLLSGRPLLPVRTRFLPGCYYLHDLAMVGGKLYGNSVGQNAVVELGSPAAQPVWWPRCIDRAGGPAFGRNYLQLNSIAAGADLVSSFFTASCESIGRYRPGDLRFAVDRRGAVFSGATREPVVRGLTRPHSARLHAGTLWVDNSGYGEVGIGRDGRFDAVARLPGWTRGLCFAGGVAFVGTSRVIPRFRRYAPGLDVSASVCAVHAIEVSSGKQLGRYVWPGGNQIFAIEAVPARWSRGFPFRMGRGADQAAAAALFYAFKPG